MTNNDLFKSIQNIHYTICVYSNLILANARNGYGKIIFVRGFLFLPFLQAILLQLSDVMRDLFLLFAAIRFKSGLSRPIIKLLLFFFQPPFGLY